MKEFLYHRPYGKAGLFEEKVDKADLDKLAKLIKIVGFLLQTKVYLFWRSPQKSITVGAREHYQDNLNWYGACMHE